MTHKKIQLFSNFFFFHTVLYRVMQMRQAHEKKKRYLYKILEKFTLVTRDYMDLYYGFSFIIK